MDKIIEQVKEKMKERGISAYALGRKIFKNHQTAYNFLQNKDVNVSTLLKILEELDMKLYVKDKEKWECKNCGWRGADNELSHQNFDNGYDSMGMPCYVSDDRCPECNEYCEQIN